MISFRFTVEIICVILSVFVQIQTGKFNTYSQRWAQLTKMLTSLMVNPLTKKLTLLTVNPLNR